MNSAQIREYLEFYRDLGFEIPIDLRTRRCCSAPLHRTGHPVPMQSPPALPCFGSPRRTTRSIKSGWISAIASAAACVQARNNIVFGSGNETASLVFVGEGPGADEDEQGLPFVGRAGQLLTQMIEKTAAKEGIPIRRPDVYICNVVKCRPPENRTPHPDEMEICGQFLFRQLESHSAEGHLRIGRDRYEGAIEHERRHHEVSRKMAQVARHPCDDHLSSFLFAAPIQSASQARGVGRFENFTPFRL